MFVGAVALVPDAVNTALLGLTIMVNDPDVSTCTHPHEYAPELSCIRHGAVRVALGRIVVGPPVKENDVALDVPVIAGISIVTLFPTRTNVTVPVGVVVSPVAVAV